jgi:hypothetical protein
MLSSNTNNVLLNFFPNILKLLEKEGNASISNVGSLGKM